MRASTGERAANLPALLAQFSREIAIEPGDLLLIYTDGVIEAVNEAGGEFGLERLRAFVRETFSRSADFQQRLFASVDAFTGQSRQFDDITCMVIQVAA